MRTTSSRRIRVSRPTLDILESLSLVSVLPTLAAVPEWMDAQTGGVIFAEVARMDRPTPATLGFPSPSSHTNGPNWTTPAAANPLEPVGEGAAGAPASRARSNPTSDPALSFATAADSGSPPESDLFDSSSTGPLPENSNTAGLNPTPAPAAQARSSPAGAISHGPATIANASARTPAAPAAPKQPAAATATAGATTALSAAVGQSLGDGIRPMTMAPTRAGVPRVGDGRAAASISPDMGSGGNPGGAPPLLDSYTFGIEEPNSATDPGVYTSYDNNPIPIGASCGLEATSPYGEEDPIVSWSWNGGSGDDTWVSGPANGAPNIPQAAPGNPGSTGQGYGFIVVPTYGMSYNVTVTVTYKYGTQGSAQLSFAVDVPNGSLSVQQAGVAMVNQSGAVMVSPPMQFSASVGVDEYEGGDFMFMQILVSDLSKFVAVNGRTFFISNTTGFQDNNGRTLNGPLLDSDIDLGYGYYYNGKTPSANPASWHLSVPSGQTHMPAPGLAAPFISDGPNTQAHDSVGDQQLSVQDSYATYLMYKSDIQGSVWIAISQINWSFGETAANGGSPNAADWTGNPSPVTTTGPLTPSGVMLFPYGSNANNQSWVNTSFNYLKLFMNNRQGAQLQN